MTASAPIVAPAAVRTRSGNRGPTTPRTPATPPRGPSTPRRGAAREPTASAAAGTPSGPREAFTHPRHFPLEIDSLCLYGCAGSVTTLFGGLRPGQTHVCAWRRRRSRAGRRPAGGEPVHLRAVHRLRSPKPDSTSLANEQYAFQGLVATRFAAVGSPDSSERRTAEPRPRGSFDARASTIYRTTELFECFHRTQRARESVGDGD